MQTRHRWTLALAAAALAVVFAVHAPMLAYPYVQEDWEILGQTSGTPPLEAIAAEFTVAGTIHYRPLVATYLIVLDQIVGTDGLLSHVIVLLLLAGASLMVALVIERLTGDKVLASLVAVSHAAANVIHIDPLMIQTCGMENMGGTLAFFLSAWLFLKSRNVASAFFYAVGLLVKETTVVLPGFLLLTALLDGPDTDPLIARVRSRVPRLWCHALVLIAYLIVKSRGQSPFHVPPTAPYYMSLFGIHLFTNLATYLRWSLDAILPTAPSVLAALLAAAVGIAALVVGRPPMAPLRRPRFLLFLAGWFLLGIAPMLVLPNHTYRYYLEFALPAALALWWSAVRSILARVLARPRGDYAAAALALALAVVALIDVRVRVAHATELDGANATLERATTVWRVQSLLERDCGKVPQGGTLLFDHIEVWSFGKELGPRLWCRNPNLNAFTTDNLRIGENGALAIVNAPRHQGELYTGAHNRYPLDPATTFVVYEQEERLVVEPIKSYVESRDDR